MTLLQPIRIRVAVEWNLLKKKNVYKFIRNMKKVSLGYDGKSARIIICIKLGYNVDIIRIRFNQRITRSIVYYYIRTIRAYSVFRKFRSP